MQIHAYQHQAAVATSQQKWQKISLDLNTLCGHVGSKDSSIIAFLDGEEINSQGQNTYKRLSTTFGIPSLFWTELCQEASGFFWAKEEANQSTTSQGSSIETCFRFLIKHGASSRRPALPSFAYHWEKLGFASSWTAQRGLVMLCFDIPADLQEKIGEVLLAGNATQYGQGPFSLHAILMLRIVESFDRAVWSWRDVVRDLEKTRASDDALEKRSFEHMHETARHVIHCSEMLETAISVAESAAKEVRGSPSYQGDVACSTIVKDLELSVSLLTSLRNRSQALEKRLDNEINLALHLNARHDSLVNNRIAELAHRDGQVMKGIGILGMVFLPGTFVSAIFSMSFFNISDESGKWTLSSQFWMYWVVALPLTALTLVLWYCWQKGYIRRKVKVMP